MLMHHTLETPNESKSKLQGEVPKEMEMICIVLLYVILPLT